MKSFKANFSFDSELKEKFFEFAEKKKVEYSEDDYQKSKKIIDTQVMALFARNLFTTSTYFEIINELNDSFLEAVNVIQSDEFEKAKLEYE